MIDKYLLCFCLGAASCFAFAPYHMGAILIPLFSGLLYILYQTKNIKTAFLLGWTFGFGYFLTGLYWVGFAFKTVGLGYLMPIPIIGLPLLLGLFPALACALTVFYQRTPVSQVLLFSAFWSLFEWTRGHILTGFPWNLVGYACPLPILQTTAFIGIYGLSLITIFCACVLASRSKPLIVGAFAVLSVLWIAGSCRLEHAKSLGNTEINMRLIQPCIPQGEKFTPAYLARNLDLHVALSQLTSEKPLHAVIWPEASVPFLFNQDSAAIEKITHAVPQNGILLIGATHHLPGEMRSGLFALDDHGDILKWYDKFHLVPFGEYIPLKKVFLFKKLTAGTFDYTPGKGVKTMVVDGLPAFSPLICYEAIFPGYVIQYDVRLTQSNPEWILNITNDAWYGRTNGPYQHLSIVRVRAIEEGLPLVRVANNGISAVIDAYGNILYHLDLDKIGFIDFTLPRHLITRTIYGQWKEIPFGILLIGFLSIGYFLGHRRSNDTKNQNKESTVPY
ncbi:MAG: apolipoprotein N-acyltransferase [Alphaproteobacteria bacterium]|nr:apolipoprotein N-acyltransferase [Alphaproteobacteria bacterium]